MMEDRDLRHELEQARRDYRQALRQHDLFDNEQTRREFVVAGRRLASAVSRCLGL